MAVTIAAAFFTRIRHQRRQMFSVFALYKKMRTSSKATTDFEEVRIFFTVLSVATCQNFELFGGDGLLPCAEPDREKDIPLIGTARTLYRCLVAHALSGG